MEEWLNTLRRASENRSLAAAASAVDPTVVDSSGTELWGGGNHLLYATTHARPTYCNVCRDALYGVTSHGLSCEVCKYKVHKRCSAKAINNCKWTTLASIGKDIIEDQDGNITMPHQWVEGNLPVSSKCFVCEKTCGSVLRLQDWRCLWCRATVHTACRPAISVKCPLGLAKLSVVPPTALHSIGSDEAWEAVRPTGCSPLLVFVNSKSGDNQGVKFLRRFKQLLNPAQVFDLIRGGPGPGLRLFRHFDPFRILVCSGDGSVGWVLSEIDRLGMHKQCQVGVLPLGTGNDLARVLGWGASCDDDAHLPQLLEKYEKAGTKMLDRWSIMTFERSVSLPCHKVNLVQPELQLSKSSMVHRYEDSVVTHITNILQSDQDAIILSSAKVLCETVKDFASHILEASLNTGDCQLGKKCEILQQKLDLLLHTLCREENYLSDNREIVDETLAGQEACALLDNREKGALEKPEKDMTNLKRVRRRRSFVERANSLKRAIRRLVEHTELTVDEQNNPRDMKEGNGESPCVGILSPDDNDVDDAAALTVATVPTTTTITCTAAPASATVAGNKQQLIIPGLRVDRGCVHNLLLPMQTIESGSSAEISPCSSPTPNVASLSPMPDLRRDSQPEELLTLPAPDGFADSRRNSSTTPQGAFSFDETAVVAASNESVQCSEYADNDERRYDCSSECKEPEGFCDIHIIVSESNFEMTSTTTTTTTNSQSSDDVTTIQDTMVSPDTDSLHSRYEVRSDPSKRGSCSNSIISTDSVASDSFDSRSYTVRNSESEIGHIDSDIFDSTKRSDCSEIGHIDSPDNSDALPTETHNSEMSMVDDLSSLGQDLISTMLAEKYDSVRECLESVEMEKPRKYCSLAQFVEGNDIARRSFKRSSRSCAKTDKEDALNVMTACSRAVGNRVAAAATAAGSIATIANISNGVIAGTAVLEAAVLPQASPAIISTDNEERLRSLMPTSAPETMTADKDNGRASSDLLSPVCCFTVSSDATSANDDKQSGNFPPTISVIVDPPSPSMSVGSHRDIGLRRFSGSVSGNGIASGNGSMEKLSVEFPDLAFSPQATRRISSGSLLKASEIVSLAASAAKFGGSSASLRHERAKSVDKTEDVKKLPIINPLVQLPMWPNVSGGSGLISQALLANADALCAAVSPLMDPDETLMEGYFERCVMNNYFGIGIDAKISLDFHHKREEHPEKCRSRAKNYMWYGVLGSKQWLQKTYKNLEQRVQLECDGQRIPLPSLQGIVVLNIPSFMGGTNFWGGTKEGDLFLAPSFDDRILEVVAVFGSVQMAASRLINLQHHRIAQCQTVQINILGEEGVPIQVDGEAWIQPPGVIRIIHKNRMQMLYRNRALETSLRTWEEKQRNTLTTVSQSSSVLSNCALQSQQQQYQPYQEHEQQQQLLIGSKPSQLNEEELNVLLGFIEVVTTLVKWVKLLIISHRSLEADLYQVAARTGLALERVHPDGKIIRGPSLRPVVTELVSSARQLYEESCELLRDKAHNLRLREDLESKLSISLAAMEQELRKCTFDERGTGLVYLQSAVPEDQGDKKNRHRGLFWLKFRRSGGGVGVGGNGSGMNSGPGNAGNHHLPRDLVSTWGVQEVCTWLEGLQLGEYAEVFASHDIRGRELLTLARRDLKELGITKVGHVKRILQAISDLNG